MVNVTAAIGAFGFGYLQDAIGHVRAVALTLVGWIVMVLIAGFSETATAFWVAANLAGLCMGSSQAAGRAIVGYLAPPARLAEFFGLWGLAVKAASIFGPLTYGAVTWIFAGNHRLGIFATGIYFVIGLALLRGIDVERGAPGGAGMKKTAHALLLLMLAGARPRWRSRAATPTSGASTCS